MPRKPKVAIIGAGIGGLTAAVAMRRRDFEVEVYEQSPQIGEIGAGVSLSPNAIKAFRALGLDRQIAAIGFESDNQLVRAWNTGDVLSKVFRKGVYQKEFGAPYLSAHRADLVDVLRQQLPDDVFHLSARCTGVETGGNSARARFRGRHGDRRRSHRRRRRHPFRRATELVRPGSSRDLPGRFAGVDWFRSMRFHPA